VFPAIFNLQSSNYPVFEDLFPAIFNLQPSNYAVFVCLEYYCDSS